MANPKLKPEEALRAGEQVSDLARKDATRLQPRLRAGMLEGLAEDLGAHRATADRTSVTRAERKARTRDQDTNAGLVVARVQAVRNAAKLAGLAAPVLKAIGIGRAASSKSVKSVREAAAMVLAGYESYPDALRSAGVLPGDIDELRGLAAALVEVDRTQEQAKVTAKEATAARKAAQLRVEGAVASILAAAELVFVDDPARLALYRAALPSRAKRKKTTPPTA